MMSSQQVAQNLAKNYAQGSKRFFHFKYKAIQAAAVWARADIGGVSTGFGVVMCCV